MNQCLHSEYWDSKAKGDSKRTETRSLPYISMSDKIGRNVDELFHGIGKICIKSTLEMERI
jgi:hypothetical protein